MAHNPPFPCPFCRSARVDVIGGGLVFLHYKCGACAEVWTAMAAPRPAFAKATAGKPGFADATAGEPDFADATAGKPDYAQATAGKPAFALAAEDFAKLFKATAGEPPARRSGRLRSTSTPVDELVPVSRNSKFWRH